jgi:Ca-activated chloride channel family protein
MKKLLVVILTLAVFGALTSAAEVEAGRQLEGVLIDSENGIPMASTSVYLTWLEDPGFMRVGQVSADGTFSFEGLPSGKYELMARADGREVARAWFRIRSGAEAFRLRFQVGNDLALTLIDADGVELLGAADLAQFGTVKGKVRSGKTGDGLDYANVVLTRRSIGALRGQMSMDGGKFDLTRVPPGEYVLKILYVGFKPVEHDLTIKDGETVELDFDLEVTTVKEFDVIATEGAAIMVNTRETESVGVEDASDFAIDSVEEAARRQAGKLYARGGRSGDVSFRLGGVAVDNPTAAQSAIERLTNDADELWILERSSTKRPANPDAPGTGCLVAIVQDEEIPVPLEHTDVRARIDGYIASVDVRQRFHNPFEETIEAEYVFPLPHDAAVNDFLMIIGERRIRGIIREKEEAREIYEQARRMGHVASLLEQERPNIFRQRVANIEPGHEIEVELHYFNALPYRDGEFEFAFPLVVGPRFNPPGAEDPIEALPRGVQPAGTGVNYLAPGERSGHDVDITVELDAGLRIQDLESLNHATSVTPDGDERALIRLSPNDTLPNKDFVLRYRVADDEVNSEILVHRDGEDGFFTMMLVPPASLEGWRRTPVEFVFVLDCSGSMSGWPMEKSKSAMRRALGQLQEGDSFQIVRFSEQASALGTVPLEATPENIRRGLDYVAKLRGGGGTMMIEGIKAALDFPHEPGRERIVSFMTDGYIGNEAEILGAIAERLGETRIFSFGIGQSVNRHLIEGMARMGRGAVAYIGLDDDLDPVDQFYQAVRHPALTDVTIDWGRMKVEQVFPQKAHDLFVGRPVLMHGRYAGRGEATVLVRGEAGGRPVEIRIDVDLDGGDSRKALPLLWARSELQHIGDQLAQREDASLEHRGLDLALDYNLVSSWTSFVAVDASEVVDQPGTRTESVPVPVPEGVDYDTTVKKKGR